MSEELNITIREAIPDDAAQLLTVMRQIGQETEFLVMDEAGIQLPEELLALQLADLYESPSNVLFLALVDECIVGTASIKSQPERRIKHIGELGVSILKEYWGLGLGSILIEELLEWAQASQEIFRIELTVQEQNPRALALYEKFGFKKEALIERGARADDGRFLKVWLMSYLVNG